MNCKYCDKPIKQADWSETGWTHDRTGLVCYRNAEPAQAVLVASEALMFAEQSIPWPDERPYEKTLAPDELED
jgi:hypothetical protein